MGSISWTCSISIEAVGTSTPRASMATGRGTEWCIMAEARDVSGLRSLEPKANGPVAVISAI